MSYVLNSIWGIVSSDIIVLITIIVILVFLLSSMSLLNFINIWIAVIIADFLKIEVELTCTVIFVSGVHQQFEQFVHYAMLTKVKLLSVTIQRFYNTIDYILYDVSFILMAYSFHN